nr:integrase, catalytic region, zinc finger, CCHC-type, peptidase aspartic, catalytic [Tanacetum cinerariifolium]
IYDILKQHQHEVNEIRAEKIARVANPLALVVAQQPVYHPQTHPTYYNQNSSTRTQQAVTRNRGKAIVNSPQPIYDQEPSMVDDDDDDETSKDKEIDKLMVLISLSFKKIYKPTNNNLRTSSNTSRDYSPRIHRNAGYESQRSGNVVRARETIGSLMEEAGIQLNAEQADWNDDTDDESNDQELEAHYMYMAKIQEVSPDADDSGPIFDTEPEKKVQNDDHYDVFAIECQHPEQSNSIHKTYLIEQDSHNVSIELVDMNYDSKQIDQNDEDVDLAKERELLASLIEKLKCEIDETKNRNTLLETSNKVLVEKLKSEIADFKNKNKSLTEANNKLSEENDLLSYNKYTQTINDLNQTISEMKNKLSAHQDTISILKQQKDAQIKLYKSRKDKEIEKVIDLENKVKVFDNIVYKTGQSVQTMNMLNNKCRTSFAKPELFKKAKQANPHLYDIGVNPTTSVSRPHVKSNPIGDRVMCNNSQGKKQEVEDQRRNVKLSKSKTSVTAFAKTLKKTVSSEPNQKPRNITRKLYERVSKTCSWWHPKFTPSRYKWKPKFGQENVNPNLVEIVLFIIDSGCSKHMTRNLKLLINFMEKFLGTVKFGNNQIATIIGYGDLVQGAVTIKRVYYVEGLSCFLEVNVLYS